MINEKKTFIEHYRETMIATSIDCVIFAPFYCRKFNGLVLKAVNIHDNKPVSNTVQGHHTIREKQHIFKISTQPTHGG
jgi:hypothetical protein